MTAEVIETSGKIFFFKPENLQSHKYDVMRG